MTRYTVESIKELALTDGLTIGTRNTNGHVQAGVVVHIDAHSTVYAQVNTRSKEITFYLNGNVVDEGYLRTVLTNGHVRDDFAAPVLGHGN